MSSGHLHLVLLRRRLLTPETVGYFSGYGIIVCSFFLFSIHIRDLLVDCVGHGGSFLSFLYSSILDDKVAFFYGLS